MYAYMKQKLTINEIIGLLPSPELKIKIKETNYRFSENELLQIIRKYAYDFDERLSLLKRFAEISSPEISELAKVCVEYEEKNYKHFIESSEGFVYEVHIKETPDSYDEKYLCSSYNAAILCIDLFYKEYANVAKETEKTKYKILKRKIFSVNDKFEEDVYAEAELGCHKRLLNVSDYKNYCDLEIMCSECKEICPRRNYELSFPCFVHNYDIIKYQDDEGRDCYGVNLCLNKCDGFAQELYVIPLNASEIRERRFDDCIYSHLHLDLPLATLATPDDLDETERKNYFDFVEYLKEHS